MTNDKSKPNVQEEQVSTGHSRTPELSPEEQKQIQKESILKSIIGMIIGLTAGTLSYLMLGEGTAVSWILLILVVAIFAYYIQRRIIFPMLKLDRTPIKTGEWFGNVFLVIIFCLVIWTILLNIGAPVWVEEPIISADESYVQFGIDKEVSVSYVILDYEEVKRKHVDFENAKAVDLKSETITTSKGKAENVFVGLIDETPNDGEMMYIKASVPAFSFKKEYEKTKIYGPLTKEFLEEENKEK